MFRHLSFAFLMLAIQVPCLGAPIVNSSVFFVDRRAPTTVPGFESPGSERTQWSINVTTGGACSDVSVVASRPGSTPFSLFLNPDPIFSNCDFSRLSISWPTVADLLSFAAQTNPWSYTVSDGSGSVTGLFPLINDPDAVPFATDILVSDSGTTPTVSWTLPDLTSFDIDRIRLRITDTESGLSVFQAILDPDATSYTFDPGILQAGSNYFYRVLIEDLENGLLENRSVATSSDATRVPEPGTLVLVAAALMALVGLYTRRRGGANVAPLRLLALPLGRRPQK